MSAVMKGIRILEVAEHTFVPAASAVLSDWGADVIKVEHAERGDAMRGLARTGVIDLSQGVHVLNEHSNRGKRSIGIDLAKPEGRDTLYALAKTSDVFLTNKLPHILDKLQIDVASLRAQNPKIIYVRGTAFGIFSLVNGIALLIASIVAGVVWQTLGASATFYVGATFAGAALLLLLVSLRSRHWV